MGQHAAEGSASRRGRHAIGDEVRGLIEAEEAGVAALSERQRQVVDLVRVGVPMADIADRLGLSPHTVRHHLFGIRERLQAPVPAAAPRQGPTPRQVEVLRLLADGATNREAAEVLGVSQATIQTHIGALCDLLGVRTRRRLIGRAVALGLIPPPQGVLPSPGEAGLSSAQRHLILLLEGAATNREIAEVLGISEAAAGSRVARLCARMGGASAQDVSDVRRRLAHVTTTDAPPTLTPRQGEILALMREGLTDLQIASRLGLGVERVKNCVKALRRRCSETIPARRRGRRAGAAAQDGVGRPKDLSEHRITAAGLTPRQGEVIRLTRDGHGAESIAGILGISLITVRMHRHYAYRALADGRMPA